MLFNESPTPSPATGTFATQIRLDNHVAGFVLRLRCFRDRHRQTLTLFVSGLPSRHVVLTRTLCRLARLLFLGSGLLRRDPGLRQISQVRSIRPSDIGAANAPLTKFLTAAQIQSSKPIIHIPHSVQVLWYTANKCKAVSPAAKSELHPSRGRPVFRSALQYVHSDVLSIRIPINNSIF